jgi:hypothetical protein
MSAYLPNDWTIAALVVGLLIAELLLGFAIARVPLRLARGLAWAMTIAGTVLTERLTANEPAGFRMVAIILALLYAMKSVVTVESEVRLSPLRWLGFSVLWFGMRPGPFAKAGRPELDGWKHLVLKGVGRAGIGFLLFLPACFVWEQRESIGADETSRWLATPPLLIGLSLMLHFGLFNVLAGLWRRVGVDCRPLFRAPALASGLNDFWSQRWNMAFSEMTSLAVYRPISAVLGRKCALVAAFVASGLLHELAISVPVKAGYGLPSLYFILHGLLVLIETALAKSGKPVNRRLWLGRIWVWFWVVVPLPILFHRPFLAGVVWPLIGA